MLIGSGFDIDYLKKAALGWAILIPMLAAIYAYIAFRMGLFKKKDESENILETFSQGRMTENTFYKEFGQRKIYYSTPFGDSVDGSKKLFLCEYPCKGAFNPCFTDQKRMKAFYKEMGRAGYLIMEGTLKNFLETTNSVNQDAPFKMGVVINPDSVGVGIAADKLEGAITKIE